jgi:hypothetical protein
LPRHNFTNEPPGPIFRLLYTTFGLGGRHTGQAGPCGRPVGSTESTPPTPEDPTDLHSYSTCFKLREPLLVDFIEEYIVVFNQERDILSTLEGTSEARIARRGLAADLMTRIKASVKTWRRAVN